MPYQNKRYQKVGRSNVKASKKKPLLLIILGIVILLIAAFAVWQLVIKKDDSKKTTDSSAIRNASDQPKIDLSPPTDEEKKAAEEHKQQVVEQQKKDEQAQDTPTAGNVAPVINNAQQYSANIEVASSVEGVVEDGGTCTMTATLGSNKVVKTATGIRNAKNTICPTYVIPRAEFTQAGNWTVVVSYKSAAHSGTSKSVIMEVK